MKKIILKAITIINASFAYLGAFSQEYKADDILGTWLNEDKDGHIEVYKEGDNISKAVFDPIITIYKNGDVVMCKLENNIPDTEIFYSVDNTYPVKYANKYSVPFEIPSGNLSLRAQTFRDGKPLGRELKIAREDLVKRIKK